MIEPFKLLAGCEAQVHINLAVVIGIPLLSMIDGFGNSQLIYLAFKYAADFGPLSWFTKCFGSITY